MTKPALLLSILIGATATAGTHAPRAPTPPPAPTGNPIVACRATGVMVAKIAHHTDAAMGGAGALDQINESELIVLDGGAWQRRTPNDTGKLATTSSGCVPADVLKRLRAEIAAAKWNVKKADATCLAISSEYVEYSVKGSLKWTAHVCQPEYLDAVSQKVIAELDKLYEAYGKAAAIEGLGHKP